MECMDKHDKTIIDSFQVEKDSKHLYAQAGDNFCILEEQLRVFDIYFRPMI